jgi:hypothetical protein
MDINFASFSKSHINMGIIIIETQENNGIELGISFDGYNPNTDWYFKMIDKETAFRLKKYLTEYSPVPLDEPVGVPSNKFWWLKLIS